MRLSLALLLFRGRFEGRLRNSATGSWLVREHCLLLEDIVRQLSKYLVAGSSAAAALGLLLAASPLSAQSMGEKTGVNSTLGIAPSTADFVKEVANSDMFEIESSKLAEQKGNEREKTFASQMV